MSDVTRRCMQWEEGKQTCKRCRASGLWFACHAGTWQRILVAGVLRELSSPSQNHQSFQNQSLSCNNPPSSVMIRWGKIQECSIPVASLHQHKLPRLSISQVSQLYGQYFHTLIYFTTRISALLCWLKGFCSRVWLCISPPFQRARAGNRLAQRDSQLDKPGLNPGCVTVENPTGLSVLQCPFRAQSWSGLPSWNITDHVTWQQSHNRTLTLQILQVQEQDVGQDAGRGWLLSVLQVAIAISLYEKKERKKEIEIDR